MKQFALNNSSVSQSHTGVSLEILVGHADRYRFNRRDSGRLFVALGLVGEEGV